MTEAEIDKLNQGRVLRAETNALLPLLAEKERQALGRLIAYFKAGKRDEIFATTAELSVLSDLRTDIVRKNKQTNSLEEKAYAAE